jgi:ribosome biogenesis protein YTM1
MDMNVEVEDNSRRVQVRFVTKLKPPLKVPPTSIAIPSNLTRLGLSTIVNNLLQAGTVALVIFLGSLKQSVIYE